MVSNRKNAFATPKENPSKIFLNWKSNEKCFNYYDKSAGQNVDVQLPLRFVVLDQLSSVKGWSDSLNGKIISNEVKFISKETITAKCYHKNAKGDNVTTEIAKGLYKDIKDKVNAVGGKYHKSVYIMLQDGTLANIQLKGASVKDWTDFTQKNRNRLPDEWIIIDSAIDMKKGAVKFTVPALKFERSLTDDESTQADQCFDELESYLKTYLTKSEPNIEEIEVIDEEVISDDDLDF